MLSEEEIESIKALKSYINAIETFGTIDYKCINNLYEPAKTILNLITKLQKENEKKDEEIKELKENVDYQVLCDFLINSVSNEEPIWTEKHIEELLENFEVRWKDAYKQNS